MDRSFLPPGYSTQSVTLREAEELVAEGKAEILPPPEGTRFSVDGKLLFDLRHELVSLGHFLTSVSGVGSAGPGALYARALVISELVNQLDADMRQEL